MRLAELNEQLKKSDIKLVDEGIHSYYQKRLYSAQGEPDLKHSKMTLEEWENYYTETGAILKK